LTTPEYDEHPNRSGSENIKEIYPNAKMDVSDIEKLSKAHADWICKILNFVLTDFGVHMYKHGFEDGKKQKHNTSVNQTE
jgi:hypothetical protein